MRVELLDKDENVVLEPTIPPYDEPPGMIMWGSRIFIYVATIDRHPNLNREVVHVYRETFMHHIPNEDHPNEHHVS